MAKAYRLLKAILETAVVDELIPRNPCLIKGASVERPAERVPATIDQVYALADTIGDRYRVLILFAAFTGLRWGELIALTRRRFDLEAATVRVVEQYVELKDGSRVLGPPKSNAGVRTVAIPPRIIEELKDHLKRFSKPGLNGLVFPSPDGEPLRRSNFYRRIYRPAARSAGLPDEFTFHDLRHTGNTLAASTGASTRELMARLGHASPRAALIYQHATASRDQLIAKSISEMVLGRSPVKMPSLVVRIPLKVPTRDGPMTKSGETKTAPGCGREKLIWPRQIWESRDLSPVTPTPYPLPWRSDNESHRQFARDIDGATGGTEQQSDSVR